MKNFITQILVKKGLKQKLTTLNVGPIILIALLLITSFYGGMKMNSSLKNTRNVQAPLIRLSAEMQSSLSNVQRWIWLAYINNEDLLARSLTAKQVRDEVDHYEKAKTEYLKLPHSKEEEAIFKELVESWGNVEPIINKVITVYEKTEKSKDKTEWNTLIDRLHTSFGPLLNVFELLNSDFEKIAQLRFNDMTMQVESTQKTSSKLNWLVVIIALTGAAFSLYIGKIIAEAISSPILKVSESIDALKDGDLTKKVNIEGHDEIAQMANRFDETVNEMIKIFNSDKIDWKEISKQKERELQAQNKVKEALLLAEKEKQEAVGAQNAAQAAMKSAEELRLNAEAMAEKEKLAAIDLKNKVDKILKIVKLAENGDLTHHLDVYGDDAIGQMAEGLRSFFNQLTLNFKEIDEMAKMLSIQSLDLNKKTQDINQYASSSLEQSNEMKNKTEKVHINIKNLGHSTSELKNAINEISKQALNSSQSTNQAVKFVSEVKDLGIKLENNTEEISGFVGTINAIANQTNLLALNATIEAARAGEMGKGFAVVANEVKQLAHQSLSAADDITNKITTIKDNTKEVMDSIYRVIEIIENIDQSSKIVASASEEQFATSEQFLHIISNSVNEVEEIKNGSNLITNSAKSTNHIVIENNAIVKRLDETSIQLNNLVKKFKLNVKSDGESKLANNYKIAS